jgi:hypothetical protein
LQQVRHPVSHSFGFFCFFSTHAFQRTVHCSFNKVSTTHFRIGGGGGVTAVLLASLGLLAVAPNDTGIVTAATAIAQLAKMDFVVFQVMTLLTGPKYSTKGFICFQRL